MATRLIMSASERRRAPRSPERVSLSISDASGEFRAETKNISSAGIYCALEQFVPPMSKLNIRFELPGRIRRTKIRCTVVVVRVEPSIEEGERMNYNTALFFTDISKGDRAAVSRFVRKRLSASPTQSIE